MAFIIFWMSVFAMIFFVLGIFFKGLASMFKGAVDALVMTGTAFVLAILAFIVILILYGIVYFTAREGFLMMLVAMLALIVGLGITMMLNLAVMAAVVALAGLILPFLCYPLLLILGILSSILEGASTFCEYIYNFLLNAIIRQLEKG